jgi:hypothetical protein
MTAIGRIYAIEAKVRDWSGALRQVRSYGVWADAYVLVMGELSPKITGHLRDEVENDRGGLVVNGKWLRRPVLGHHSNARRLWASEHVVSAMTTPITSLR